MEDESVGAVTGTELQLALEQWCIVSPGQTPILIAPEDADMGLGKDLFNGIISLVISVAFVVVTADDEDAPFGMGEMLLSVAVTAFLSGFFTSYFAKE